MIKRQKEEIYFSNAKQTNEKISNAVYPLLIQNQPIERDGVEIIIESFAKESGIKKRYLHTYPSLIKHAIAKITSGETSLSDKKRAGLINRLSIELKEAQKTGDVITPKIDKSDILTETKEENRKTTFFWIITAFATIIAGLISIIWLILPSSDYATTKGSDFNLLLFILIIVIFIVVSNLLTQLILWRGIKKENNTEERE